jgi:hypothetical protein
MANTFWSSNTIEPKRTFRFLMDISPLNDPNSIASYYVKSAGKPSFQMEGGAQVKYIQHTFKYPGRVMWQPITVTILDPAVPDATAILMNILASSGYFAPKDETLATVSISKQSANAALGGIKLRQIDADGNEIEEWTLNNPYLSNVTFGEVSMDSDDIPNYQLTIEYDYATLAKTSTPVIGVVATGGSKQLPPNFS